jgi:hypothetical protein
MNQAPTIKKFQFDFAHNNAGLMNQTPTINQTQKIIKGGINESNPYNKSDPRVIQDGLKLHK